MRGAVRRESKSWCKSWRRSRAARLLSGWVGREAAVRLGVGGVGVGEDGWVAGTKGVGVGGLEREWFVVGGLLVMQGGLERGWVGGVGGMGGGGGAGGGGV